MKLKSYKIHRWIATIAACIIVGNFLFSLLQKIHKHLLSSFPHLSNVIKIAEASLFLLLLILALYLTLVHPKLIRHLNSPIRKIEKAYKKKNRIQHRSKQ